MEYHHAQCLQHSAVFLKLIKNAQICPNTVPDIRLEIIF